MTYSNNPNKQLEGSGEFSDEMFSRLLREVDEFYGDAPGMIVPPHFAACVVAKAATESIAAVERKSIWNWFVDFSMPVRVAAVSALLLASWGGIRAGSVITELVTVGRKPDPVAHIETAPAEQSLVQLVRGEAAVVTGKASQKTGDPQ